MSKASPRRPGRPRQGERDSGASRRALLDAAVEVFADRGFAATSVDEVIRRAGLSKGTFYFNFASKEDLFESVLMDRIDAPARDLMQLLSDAPPDAPTSGTISAALGELIRRERTTLLLLHDYAGRAARDADLAERYRTRRAALREVLARALEARHEHLGVPLRMDAHRLAEVFLSLAQALALEAIIDPSAVDDELYGETLALVYDGLVVRASREAGYQ